MKVLRLALLSLALVTAAMAGSAACGNETPAAPATQQDQRTHICPMRCVKQGESQPYTQPGPGKCPVCNMDMVPQ